MSSNDQQRQVALTEIFQALRKLPHYPRYRGPNRTEVIYLPKVRVMVTHPSGRLRLVRADDGHITLQYASPDGLLLDDELVPGIVNDIDIEMLSEEFFEEFLTAVQADVAQADEFKLMGMDPESGGGWFRRHVFGAPADELAFIKERLRKESLKRFRGRYILAHKGRKPKR